MRAVHPGGDDDGQLAGIASQEGIGFCVGMFPGLSAGDIHIDFEVVIAGFTIVLIL